MARAQNEKVIVAEKLFKKGYKLIDIAKELDVPDGTVRRWKKTYSWDSERSDKNSERSVKKDKKKTTQKEAIADEVKDVMENENLTDKQRLFCIYYSKCFNATKAYQKAYKVAYDTATSIAYRLMENDVIKAQIDELTKITINKEVLKRGLLQQYIDIAFADITDYIEFGNYEIPIKDKQGNFKLDENGMIATEIVSYVKLGESKKVDGRLITEVSEGREGIKIKLADKMKAMDFLKQHTNLLSDEEKSKLDIENKKLNNDKIRAEITKITGADEPEVEDDGFLEALKGRTAEVWKNE